MEKHALSIARALATACLLVTFVRSSAAVELKPGDAAPLFTAESSIGGRFDLADRKGAWTVLYFYPKAGTSGCTRQAQSFRDHIDTIRSLGADVFGISTDTAERLATFRQEEQLTFELLADPDGRITEAYGTKMPLLTRSRRRTFILDPSLRIRQIQHDVDPVEDAPRVAAEIARLQREPLAPIP